MCERFVSNHLNTWKQVAILRSYPTHLSSQKKYLTKIQENDTISYIATLEWVSESRHGCHWYRVSVFSARYALRMKKELSIERIIQYIINRCQYSDRCDKLSVFALRIKKTLLCVSEWEKHQLSWLPVMSDSFCHIERRFHVTLWGWINIWASIV
jgi:hypothetical protein